MLLAVTTPQRLAESERSFVIAPAGCGKTHLVAQALEHLDGRRQLLLTHTHAGVRALRNRLRTFGISTRSHRVDTIAGFALRIAASFPASSGCETTQPTGSEWPAVYDAAVNALSNRHVRAVLQASYTGILVDEYQDCTLRQHALIVALAQLLPTRLVGDPLQGIFDFAEETVDFDVHVASEFERLEDLTTPYRWLDTNPDLGEWLLEIRTYIAQQEVPPFDDGPVTVLPSGALQQVKVCQAMAARFDGSIVGVRAWPKGAHGLAMRLGGEYTSMEEVECRDLMRASAQIDATEGPERALEVVEFAKECMTKASSYVRTARKAYQAGRLPRVKRGAANEEAVAALNAVASDTDTSLVAEALKALAALPGVEIYRAEAYGDMLSAIALHQTNPDSTLRESAWNVRDGSRHLGRRVDTRTISRTLLVKGLEFDHAVVLDVDEHITPKQGARGYRNLYVAMTRGAHTLTVLR